MCCYQFKVDKTRATMRMGIIRKREYVCKFIPFARMFGDVVTEGSEKRAVESFGLATRLRMVSRSVEIGYTDYATCIREKTPRELFPVVEKEFARRTVQKKLMFVKSSATSCAVLVRKGTVLVNIKKQFVITNKAVLPLFDSISGPRMSMVK